MNSFFRDHVEGVAVNVADERQQQHDVTKSGVWLEGRDGWTEILASASAAVGYLSSDSSLLSDRLAGPRLRLQGGLDSHSKLFKYSPLPHLWEYLSLLFSIWMYKDVVQY